MTSLNRIELFLNIDTTNLRLCNGLKKRNKNQFFWFRNQYLIVKLTQEKWCIVSCEERSIDLLNDNVFCYDRGYARNSDNGDFHGMLMKPPQGLVVDHINIKSFDNRLENLRIVTQKINNQNRPIQKNNISGVNGVCKSKQGIYEYYQASITDNNDIKLHKSFSIAKLGDVEAKRQAIEQRLAWKIEFNYRGE